MSGTFHTACVQTCAGSELDRLWLKADLLVGSPMPLKLAAMLCAPSPAVPEFCRNQSSSVVLSYALASTGASS